VTRVTVCGFPNDLHSPVPAALDRRTPAELLRRAGRERAADTFIIPMILTGERRRSSSPKTKRGASEAGVDNGVRFQLNTTGHSS
jgi:hypothetical protein